MFQVPFFSDEENSNTPRADAFLTPRENPRALLIRSLKKETAAPLKDETTPLQENGKLAFYIHWLYLLHAWRLVLNGKEVRDLCYLCF